MMLIKFLTGTLFTMNRPISFLLILEQAKNPKDQKLDAPGYVI